MSDQKSSPRHSESLHPDHISLAEIDTYMSGSAFFNIIDWCLSRELLTYKEYEKWRQGDSLYLVDKLGISIEDFVTLLAQAENFSAQLNLVAQEQNFLSWSSSDNAALKFSSDRELNARIAKRWYRSAELPQLDLFMDNSAMIAENGFKDAIVDRQFDKAKDFLNELTHHDKNHQRLGSFQDLLNYSQHVSAVAEELAELGGEALYERISMELDALEIEVVPLASSALATQERDYLTFAWRNIGDCAAHLSFNHLYPKAHWSYFLMKLGDWQGLADAIETSDEYRKNYPVAERAALALANLGYQSRSLVIILHAMELNLEMAEAFIESGVNPLALRIWESFYENFEDPNAAHFPAFVLLAESSVLSDFDSLSPKASPLTMVAHDLVSKRSSNSSEVEARKELSEFDKHLLRFYLSKESK